MNPYDSMEHNKIMPDDLQVMEDVFFKKVKSYLGRIPSQDFDSEQYEVFLTIASPEELEEDILTRETLNKIMENF